MKDDVARGSQPVVTGRVRESWLISEDHERWASAATRCQNPSGECFRTGECSYRGDCFSSDSVLYDYEEIERLSNRLIAACRMRSLARAERASLLDVLRPIIEQKTKALA